MDTIAMGITLTDNGKVFLDCEKAFYKIIAVVEDAVVLSEGGSDILAGVDCVVFMGIAENFRLFLQFQRGYCVIMIWLW